MYYAVTRHTGALEWLQQHLQHAFTHLNHLPNHYPLQPGDVVVGTLPIQMVAHINQQGARYMHLHINLPPQLRGQELTAQQLNTLGAQLVEYRAQALIAPHPASAP